MSDSTALISSTSISPSISASCSPSLSSGTGISTALSVELAGSSSSSSSSSLSVSPSSSTVTSLFDSKWFSLSQQDPGGLLNHAILSYQVQKEKLHNTSLAVC